VSLKWRPDPIKERGPEHRVAGRNLHLPKEVLRDAVQLHADGASRHGFALLIASNVSRAASSVWEGAPQADVAVLSGRSAAQTQRP
jgi:hypothetical protein